MAQVAGLLRISKTTVHRMCEADELLWRWNASGTTIWISERSLAAWIDQGGNAEGAADSWKSNPHPSLQRSRPVRRRTRLDPRERVDGQLELPFGQVAS